MFVLCKEHRWWAQRGFIRKSPHPLLACLTVAGHWSWSFLPSIYTTEETALKEVNFIALACHIQKSTTSWSRFGLLWFIYSFNKSDWAPTCIGWVSRMVIYNRLIQSQGPCFHRASLVGTINKQKQEWKLQEDRHFCFVFSFYPRAQNKAKY